LAYLKTYSFESLKPINFNIGIFYFGGKPSREQAREALKGKSPLISTQVSEQLNLDYRGKKKVGHSGRTASIG